MHIEQANILTLNNIPLKSVYFIGIGGIGMSAVVRYLLAKGVKVSGYDLKETELTKSLISEGAEIHYEDDINKINKQADLVVYTPAIPASHKEFNFYIDNKYVVVKRSDILGWITESSFNICVAGSHGKTTVTTMIGYLLKETGYGANAFLGGIAANYNSNFWSSDKEVSVIEADEYDRSFHKLFPDVAVVTAMDADHLDIYETAENVEEAYLTFASQLKPDGCLITKKGLKREKDFNADKHITYHLENKEADVYATNIKVKDGAYVFDVHYKKEIIEHVYLPIGGLHNIENVLAAIAVAKYLGVEDDKIIHALKKFKGVRRRFEVVLKRDEKQKTVLIDDYAHHPEELNALISGVRSLYPDEKMLLVFQPHLFSRTKDYAMEFAHSLDKVDEVILLPIYPARELPMQGVTSNLITDQMQNKNNNVLSKEEMLQKIAEGNYSLVVMAGAGDIGDMVKDAEKLLKEK